MPESHGNNEGAPASAPFLILAWAGIAGAVGVALAAVAAHRVDSPALATAATMLTLHVAAAVGIIAVGMQVPRPRLWQAAGLLMLFSASLFSGEIALHTLTGNAAFQMLAPVGGTLMIASWLAVSGLAIAGFIAKR
jgi:uncharacterized membrane protein YgdD (TMEM256/DUF423 family)